LILHEIYGIFYILPKMASTLFPSMVHGSMSCQSMTYVWNAPSNDFCHNAPLQCPRWCGSWSQRNHQSHYPESGFWLQAQLCPGQVLLTWLTWDLATFQIEVTQFPFFIFALLWIAKQKRCSIILNHEIKGFRLKIAEFFFGRTFHLTWKYVFQKIEVCS